MAPPPDDPLVSYDFSSWINRLLGVVKRSGKRMTAIVLLGGLLPAIGVVATWVGIGFGIAYLLTEVLDQPDEFTPLTVVVIIAYYVSMLTVIGYFAATSTLAMIRVATNDAAGQGISLSRAYFSSTRLAWPTFGWSVLGGLLTLLGVLLCYLPGLYVSLVLSVLAPVMAFQRRSGLVGAFRLVHSDFWPTIGRLVLLAFAVSVLSMGTLIGLYVLGIGVGFVTISVAGESALDTVGPIYLVVAAIVYFAVILFAQVLSTAGSLVTYAGARARQEPGLNTGRLVAEVNA